MATQFSRRFLLVGASALGSTILVRPTLAADYKFTQYHNQTAGGTLHKNLVAMWDAVRAETNGRVEATVHAENNKLPGGDPDALKLLLAGEIQFFTLMGGIIGTVVPVAEAQQLPFAFKSAGDAHKAIDGALGKYIGEDMAGLKIRVPAGQMIFDPFEAFGPQPVTIPANGIYDGLKSGKVDAQEN